MRRTVQQDKRGVVAVWLAVMLPGLIMAISMGIEISNWAAAQLSVQRTADISAMAGAMYYKSNPSAQSAATYAARFAEMNGANGAASPTWSAGTKTVTSNQITTQVVAGLQSSSNTALKVTVAKTVPKTISQFFSSGSVTVASTSTAELVSTGGSGGGGGQPCIVALAGVTGTTSTVELTEASGSVTATGCTVRSNTGITLSGSATMTASAVYAGGTITTSGTATITGTQNPNQGQISDPYVGFTALQTALTTAESATAGGALNCNSVLTASCTGPAGSFVCVTATKTCTVQPGTYSSMLLNAGTGIKIVLSPGLYTSLGNVSMAGAGTVTGSGITILMTSPTAAGKGFTIANTGTIALSAAQTVGATNGQVPGVLFASKMSSLTTGFSVSGSGSLPFVGAMYFPNALVGFSGSSTVTANGDPGCLQVISNKISLSGAVQFNTGTCNLYGTPTYGSVAATSFQAGLVR